MKYYEPHHERHYHFGSVNELKDIDWGNDIKGISKIAYALIACVVLALILFLKG